MFPESADALQPPSSAHPRRRRKRMARPRTLIFFAGLLIALPFVNYFGLAAQYGLPWSYPLLVLKKTPPIALLLWAAPLPIGAGLLRVRRWAWYALLVYAGALILYNLAALGFSFPTGLVWYNAGALAATVFGFAAMVYFLQRDVSAPYMRNYPRGWRYQKRRPVSVPVQVDDRQLVTRDLSISGFYIDWPDCTFDPGDSVPVLLPLDAEDEASTEDANSELRLEGGVVRVDSNGAGVAFRGLSESERRRIRAFLQRREAEAGA